MLTSLEVGSSSLPAIIPLSIFGFGGANVIAAANEAFVGAMTTGFQISAVVLMSAIVIAFTLIPERVQTSQAGQFAEESESTGFGPLQPDPVAA